MNFLRKSALSGLAALSMALVLALSGCGDSDDDGDSGYTGTTGMHSPVTWFVS